MRVNAIIQFHRFLIYSQFMQYYIELRALYDLSQKTRKVKPELYLPTDILECDFFDSNQ